MKRLFDSIKKAAMVVFTDDIGLGKVQCTGCILRGFNDIAGQCVGTSHTFMCKLSREQMYRRLFF